DYYCQVWDSSSDVFF
nr:immunoglobulin light chain junction region [Macaca mulatta]MOV72347.1 immunoglobulin light chain junction region [Macaca mulatta]MOV72543.1 immunoglobulin light chain junction region [Macaca mulatta]MOV72723.1 immunoglobulin light chain junction region [Macaca mulatta]MOV72839.1 immunoglobulin light chain junction region [Macaca mulatta]